MPGDARPVVDERDGLITFLGQQRYVLKLSAYGLTDDQARARPTRSSLSLGGLIKHVATTEQGWIDRIRGLPEAGSEQAYVEGFTMHDHETLADILGRYDEVAKATDAYAAEVDLDRPVPVPPDVPWFPKDVDAWSTRWVLLHVIEETARHAGHADMLREHIDGATAFEKFRYITLPRLQPVFVTAVMLSAILTSASIQFVYILTNGGPSDRTMIFPVLSYNLALGGAQRLGMGATVSLFFFPVLVVFIIFLTRRMLREKGE